MLATSGITLEHATLRGYETITSRSRLDALKITKAGRNTPGLLVPQLRADGSTWGWQYRPDTPRVDSKGRPVKYETPWQQPNGLDVPPAVGPMLGDLSVPLFITEGVKKADSGALHGLCIVALSGVWCWLHTNTAGAKMALSAWRDIALNNSRRVILAFDGDVARNPSVQKSCHALSQYLAYHGARVEYLWLPDTDHKTGLDDYLADHTVDELWRLVKPTAPPPSQPRSHTNPDHGPAEPKPDPAEPVSLDDALAVFGKWLHINDTAPIIATAATVVANLVEGDPVWLLLVGPPSGGKTEILSSLIGLDYIIPAATITEAALLSGTPRHDRAKDATGGLLRQIGKFGILLTKDFTSVLSQNHDVARKAVAALREIYDGRWDRPVGVDGARILHWQGKCGFIGGVTPSYDRYSTIVNTLGDRYMLLRLPPAEPGKQARAALAQAEHEKQMRAELAEAMTGLIAGADQTLVHAPIDDESTIRLVNLAIYAARARTGVDRNYHTGELEVIPQPEGPARLVKAMRQLYGGMRALGVETEIRWTILSRISVDCTPRIRRPLIESLLTPHSEDLLDTAAEQRTADIAENVGMSTKTASLHLDDLALIGLAHRRKESKATNSAHLWKASTWLRDNWPPAKVSSKTTTTYISTCIQGTSSSSDDLNSGGSFASRSDGAASTNGQASGFTPPTGVGRCDECGWHIATQGHLRGCSANERSACNE
jgi:hypothetical protein